MSEGERDGQRNRRFLARYGATILRGGIATIPSALYRYQGELGLKPQHVWFISAILAHKWDEDMPKPSLKQLAPRAGVSVRHLHNLKDEIVALGYLDVVNRHNSRGGQQANYYDFSGLFGALEERLRRDRPPSPDPGEGVDDDEDAYSASAGITAVENSPRTATGGMNHSSPRGVNQNSAGGLNRRSPLKEAVDPESGGEEATIISNEKHTETLHKNNQVIQSTDITRQHDYVAATRGRTSGAASPAPPPASTGMAKLADVLAQRTLRPAASSRQDGGGGGRGRPPKAPPYLATVMEDVSQKLHDDHPRSSLTQATRLWKASGLPEDKFVQRLYEARSITQQQGSVRGRPTKDNRQPVNRVPYFFAVVEDLLGLREQGAG